jgi:carbon storage regulator CsrA
MRKGKLILTRRPGESLNISVNNVDFEISVSEVKGQQVRLVVHADERVRVVRSELLTGR